MSFIRHKVINNRTYAYEVSSQWDPKLKRSKSISKYLGPVDETTNKIIKFVKKERGKEKLILDFGDTYFLYKFIEKSDIYENLKTTFFDKYPEIIPLLIYRLSSNSPMYNCQEWIEGSVLSILLKNMKLSSQRISDLLCYLGDESVQREFFTSYLRLVGGSNNSVIIDATSLPNHIQIDFNAWGRSDGKIEKQFRLLFVVDQISKIPLFYRLLPGNITDVSTLQTTILELKAMGVNNSFVLIDAGYFSESNMIDLYQKKIDFLTRLPAGRKLYKEIILNNISGLENLKNASKFGNRTFFIKSLKINLYNNDAYAFIILDPERKAKETNELLQKYCDDEYERNEDKDNFDFYTSGVMILVCSKEIHSSEILSSYYLRQSVEQIFGFSKSDLGLLPIRNHNENTVRGYLFLQFILLIFYLKIREKFSESYTVEQVLLILKKLKCKIYETQIIPTEQTKKQRHIFEQIKILVPKFMGI